MTILVVGSNGFIGEKILFYLKKLQIPSLGITRSLWSNLKKMNLSKWCLDNNISHIIYCAGYSKRFNSENIDEIDELEVLLRFLQVKTSNLIYLSSSLVYGERNNLDEYKNLSEDLVCHPQGSYGLYKRVFERLILFSNKKNKIIRLSSCIGKDKKSGLFKIIQEKINLDSQNIEMFYADSLRDYIFVDNAAKAIIELTLNKNAKGIFNLGSNRGYKVSEIIKKFSEYYKKELKSVKFGQKMSEDPLELILNMNKTKKYISKETWENIYNKDQINFYLNS